MATVPAAVVGRTAVSATPLGCPAHRTHTGEHGALALKDFSRGAAERRFASFVRSFLYIADEFALGILDRALRVTAK
jgi:hypothetical protein